MEEINLKELFKYFISKLKIIMLITVVIVILGTIYSCFIKVPMYKSETTIVLVSTNESESTSITQNDVMLNQKLVSTYREIIKSPRILNKVVKNLKLEDGTSKLKSITSVNSVSDTELIKIAVVNEDAKLAKEIANEITDVFTEEIVEIFQIKNISILQKAEMNKTPYNKNLMKEEILYLLIGIVISCGLIFAMYYFDTTIKTVEEVEEKFELPILGQIPMRKSHKNKKGGKK